MEMTKALSSFCNLLLLVHPETYQLLQIFTKKKKCHHVELQKFEQTYIQTHQLTKECHYVKIQRKINKHKRQNQIQKLTSNYTIRIVVILLTFINDIQYKLKYVINSKIH